VDGTSNARRVDESSVISHEIRQGLIPSNYMKLTRQALWTLECLFRSNVGIHRARKSIQVDGSRPPRGSWHGFPGSPLSGTLASYGAATVARTSDRGHVVEA